MFFKNYCLPALICLKSLMILPDGLARCDQKHCFLCKHSTTPYTASIAANSQIRTFKKREVIFKEGEPTSGIFFMTGGIVKVHRQWGRNKELIIHFCSEGDILGYRGMGEGRFFTVTATALEPSTACYIELETFEQALKADHRLTYNFLNFYLDELRETEKRMAELVHLDVKGRIANTLLMLAKKFGVTDNGLLDVQLKRQDMAAYAGTTYETFFRVMDQFIKEQLIQAHGKTIRLLNKEAIRVYGSSYYVG